MPPKALERIVLRVGNNRKMEVVTFRYDGGYVTPVIHHRTKKWHATKDRPEIQTDGWTNLKEITKGHRTKGEAIAALG